MRDDMTKAVKWLVDSTAALPALDVILDQASSEVLIIGAGVFSIYQEQGWIPQFKRKTGDLDLSVGLVSGENDYVLLRDAFLENKYTTKAGDPKYRYYSPKQIPGLPNYVDLLAHPKVRRSLRPRRDRLSAWAPAFHLPRWVLPAAKLFRFRRALSIRIRLE